MINFLKFLLILSFLFSCNTEEIVYRDLDLKLKRNESIKQVCESACPCGLLKLETDSYGWIDSITCYPCIISKK